MIIGVPKEIKNGEKRVSLIPSSVKELVKNGHTVYVEKNAGSAIGFEDSLYEVSEQRFWIILRRFMQNPR